MALFSLAADLAPSSEQRALDEQLRLLRAYLQERAGKSLL